MIDWQLAVGLIAFVVLCVVLFWIEAQAEDELVHESARQRHRPANRGNDRESDHAG